MKALVGGAAVLGAIELVEDATLLIEDGRIAAVGPASDIAVPDGAERVAVEGFTLMPGFIDAHVHIGFVDPHDVVAGGVTTARDLAWPPERIWPLVESSIAPDFDGPELLAAGPMLTVEGGYPTRAAWAPPGTALVVNGPDDAASAVRAVVAAGAAVVKVSLNSHAGPVPDEPTLRAMVGAAHALDRKVTAHVNGVGALQAGVEAGLDELAHMLMGTDAIPDRLIAGMVDAGIVVVPTLAIRRGRELDVAIDNLQRFRAAGGRVVYGTDLGNEGPRPGVDRNEVEAMTAAGMSPMEILRAGTMSAAAWLGLSSKGRLAPGNDADVVAVGGDPTRDPRALTDVRRVWRGGREI